MKKLSKMRPFALARILCILLVMFVLADCSSVIAAGSGYESTTLPINNTSALTIMSGYSYKMGTLKYALDGEFSVKPATNATNNAFNKYSITYSSDSYIRGTIRYTQGYNTVTEEFFLEPGTDMVFTSLIDGYLNDVGGKNIDLLTFTIWKSGEIGYIKLNSISTIAYNNIAVSDVVYIENSRFKIGVALYDGGGLTYYEDKADGIHEVGNMLNNHDAGRLVQQSYYGTMEYPYNCATYNGTTWSYNPVQGGDQYNNKSKVLDYVIGDDYIYVKCRPLDWAQNNLYTYCYMENYYYVKDTYVEVDNRFIDFSSYNHGTARHQELPAFYTISYLDTFSFYGGSSPWTNDTVTTKYDMPFWGGNPDAYFNVKSGNTEVWCAWTNNQNGKGIGLYCPGTEILLAGRHNPTGSTNPADDGTSYVAPLRTFIMENFKPFEYSYIITSGTVEEIRSTFKENKDYLTEEKTGTYNLSGYATNGTANIPGSNQTSSYVSKTKISGSEFEIVFTPEAGFTSFNVSRSDGLAVSYVNNADGTLSVTGEMPQYDLSISVTFLLSFNTTVANLTPHTLSSGIYIAGFTSGMTCTQAKDALLNSMIDDTSSSSVRVYNADGSRASNSDAFMTGMYITVDGVSYYCSVDGDIDKDSSVTVADALTAYNHMRKGTALATAEFYAADLVENNKINILDIMAILNCM